MTAVAAVVGVPVGVDLEKRGAQNATDAEAPLSVTARIDARHRESDPTPVRAVAELAAGTHASLPPGPSTRRPRSIPSRARTVR
ncbi:hypothetical protein ACFXPN_02735 [Streptomyces griseorubiginosus]|uniref:hypothetical protein n=1 Tax=Streptomyces griseorubiginosus TaxID=67304 RepID=UPI0036BCA30E